MEFNLKKVLENLQRQIDILTSISMGQSKRIDKLSGDKLNGRV